MLKRFSNNYSLNKKKSSSFLKNICLPTWYNMPHASDSSILLPQKKSSSFSVRTQKCIFLPKLKNTLFHQNRKILFFRKKRKNAYFHKNTFFDLSSKSLKCIFPPNPKMCIFPTKPQKRIFPRKTRKCSFSPKPQKCTFSSKSQKYFPPKRKKKNILVVLLRSPPGCRCKLKMKNKRT